jgi:HEAT repeat protein
VDRVELLRRAVETPSPAGNDEQLLLRGEELKKRVDALQTLGELRRALQLNEWSRTDDKLNPKRSDQDQLYRQRIGGRFKATVEYFLSPKNADAAVRLALITMIGEMGSGVRALTPSDPPPGFTRTLAPDLIKLLQSDPSPDVRAAAARALGKINADPKEAVAPLHQALTKSPSPEVRRAAAEGFLTWIKSVDELTRAGIDAAVSARPEDLVELIKIVLPATTKGLRDADPEVRRHCLEVVQQTALAVPVPRPLSADNLRQADQLQGAVAAVPMFTNLWRPVFEQLRDEKDVLARTLEDANPRVRATALQAVQELAFLRLRINRWVNSVPKQEPAPLKGVWRAVRQPIMLAAAVQNQNQKVLPAPKELKAGGFNEENLTKALEPSVRVLARGVNDPNPRVRLSAIEFLDFMEEAAAPATDVLLGALSDRNRFVRWAAARALGKIPSASPEQVVRGVIPMLGDLDIDVRMMAAGTVERYGPRAAAAVPALTQAVSEMNDPDGLMAMLNALRNIGGEAGQSSVPAVANLLRNPVPRVRRAAAETLGGFGAYARPAEPALRAALNDEEGEVRQAVSDALLAIAPQPPQKGL